MNPGNNPDTRQSPGNSADDGAQALAGGLFGRHRRLVIGSAVFLLLSSAAGTLLATRILAPLRQVNATAHTGDAHKAQIVIREQYNALQIIPQVSPASLAVAGQPPAAVASAPAVAARPAPPAPVNRTARRPAPAASAPRLAMAPPVQSSLPPPDSTSTRPAPATAMSPARPAPVAMAPVRLAAPPVRAAQATATSRHPGPQVQVAQAPARPPVRPLPHPLRITSVNPVIAKGNRPMSRPLVAWPGHQRRPAPARQQQSVTLVKAAQKRPAHRPVIAYGDHPIPVAMPAGKRVAPAPATVHLAQATVRPATAPHVSMPRIVKGQDRLATTRQASRPGHGGTPVPAALPSRLIAQAAPGAVPHPAPAVLPATDNAHGASPNKTGGATHLASAAARPNARQQVHSRALRLRPVKPVVVEGEDDYVPRHRIASARMAPDPYDEMDDDEPSPRYDAPPRYYSPPPAYPGYMDRPPPPVYYPGW